MSPQTVPPPPDSQWEFGSQVWAAISNSGCSNPFFGSPGTTKNRHANSPLETSYAEM